MAPTNKHKAQGEYDDDGNYDFRCAEDPPCDYHFSVVKNEAHWHGHGPLGTYHVMGKGITPTHTNRLEPFEDALDDSKT